MYREAAVTELTIVEVKPEAETSLQKEAKVTWNCVAY